MENFKTRILNLPPERAREVVYFLIRYFKSARHLEKDGRDIFADVFVNEPSSEVRSATLDSIILIEEEFGSKAIDFNDSQSNLILDALTDLETSLDPVSSEEAIRKATSFLSGT